MGNDELPIKQLTSTTFHCKGLPRAARRYLPSTAASACPWCSTCFTWASGVVSIWTSCAITRCREIMTPQLSIVKTRFAKASLRPRCARHRSWGATCPFPNRRAGTLSFPIHETDRPAELPVVRNTHPQKVTPIQVAISSIPPRSVGNLTNLPEAKVSPMKPRSSDPAGNPRQSAGCFVSLITGRHTGGASPQSRCTGLLAKCLAFSAFQEW